MAWWNKDKEKDDEEKWARFNEGERQYGDVPKEEFVPGTTVVEGRPPEDRWKAFAADDKEYNKNQRDLISKEQRQAEKDRENLQFLRDTENKREIEELGERRLAEEKAKKEDWKAFEKELKAGATEGELFKQDMKDLGKDIMSGVKTVKKGTLQASRNINRYAMRTNPKGGRVDPLKGLVKSKKKTKKGKKGRPKKYKTVKGTGRPRGRPIDNDMSIGRFKFFDDKGIPEVQREPYVPPTPQQQRLLQLFGQKQQFWGYGGNPVRINKRINSGNGLIKNGDGGATGRMFGVRRF